MRKIALFSLLLSTIPLFVCADSKDTHPETFVAKVELEKSGKRVAKATLALTPHATVSSSTIWAFNRQLIPTHSASVEHKTDGQSNRVNVWLDADKTLVVSVDSAECGVQRFLATASESATSLFSMDDGECVVNVSLSTLDAKNLPAGDTHG